MKLPTHAACNMPVTIQHADTQETETMRQTARNLIISACSFAVLAGALLLTAAPAAIAADTAITKGKAVAVDRKKGNCLA